MTPTDLDRTTSVYDYTLHMPIPTNSYIAQETGEDIILNQGETKGLAFIRKWTKVAFNLLMATKPPKTKNDLEYLIAMHDTYRQAFISFVACLIADMYLIGDDAALLSTGNIKDHLTIGTRAMLEGSVLNAYMYTYINYRYRVGY